MLLTLSPLKLNFYPVRDVKQWICAATEILSLLLILMRCLILAGIVLCINHPLVTVQKQSIYALYDELEIINFLTLQF